jgi:hypothetical protein
MCGLPEIVDDSLYDGLWDTQVNCEETGCEEKVVVRWLDCPMGLSDCVTACTIEEIIGTCKLDTNGVNQGIF